MKRFIKVHNDDAEEILLNIDYIRYVRPDNEHYHDGSMGIRIGFLNGNEYEYKMFERDYKALCGEADKEDTR